MQQVQYSNFHVIVDIISQHTIRGFSMLTDKIILLAKPWFNWYIQNHMQTPA